MIRPRLPSSRRKVVTDNSASWVDIVEDAAKSLISSATDFSPSIESQTWLPRPSSCSFLVNCCWLAPGKRRNMACRKGLTTNGYSIRISPFFFCVQFAWGTISGIQARASALFGLDGIRFGVFFLEANNFIFIAELMYLVEVYGATAFSND